MDKIAITLDGTQRVVNLDYERTAEVVLICDNGDGTADSAVLYEADVAHAVPPQGYGNDEPDAATLADAEDAIRLNVLTMVTEEMERTSENVEDPEPLDYIADLVRHLARQLPHTDPMHFPDDCDHDEAEDALAVSPSDPLAVLRKIEAGRPCLDFDTTSDDLAEWARNVVVPALEEAGLL